MNIKRIVSVILCFAMLSVCVFAQADENNANNEIYGEYELGFTNALKITEIEDVSELSTDLAKGEFYKMICNLGGMLPTETPETIFADLKPGDEYEAYAKTLVRAGYISADAMGNVYVQNPISVNEALALVVSVLGYAPKAKVEGGFPTGYISVANRLKLLEGINPGKTLKVGEGIVLIYNAFTVDMMVPKYNASGKPTEYYISEDTNILTSTFGAYHYEGIVDGVDITRIAGENDVNPYRMEISDKIFDIGYIENPYDFLGYEVELIYVTKRSVDPMIVHIAALPSNTETIFDIDDITDISGTKLTAYVNGNKKKNYNFEKAVPVVYNGVATMYGFNEDLLSGKSGTVKLLDNDGNRTADVVFVNAYENYNVGYMDLDKYEIFDKYSKTKNICLDPEKDDPYVNIFKADGSEATFASIRKGALVSVYSSLDDAYQGFINAYVCEKAIVGDIQSINTSDKSVVIDDNEYEITDDAYTQLSTMLRPGVTARFLLDITGKIAGGELEADATFNYGFLIGSDAGNGGFDTKISFRIFNETSEFVEYPGAYNIKVDGVSYRNTDSELIEPILHKAAKAMYGENVADDFRASAVRYSLNSNGEINSIDTVLDGDTTEVATRATETSHKDTLFASYSLAKTKCRTYNSGKYLTVGPKITVDGNVVTAMFVPTAEEIFDDKEYTADKASVLITNEKDYQNVWGFYSDKKNARAEFVVVVGSSATGGVPHSSVRLAVVKGLSKILGDDGQEKTCVTVLHDGAEIKLIVGETGCTINAVANEKDPDLTTTMTAADLKKGDVIRYSLNSKDELSTVNLYYRCATDAVSYVDKKGFGEQISIRTGYVYETLNDGFLVYYTDKVTDLEKAQYTDEQMEFVTTAVVTSYFYKYDSSEPMRTEVKTSNADALKGYTDVGLEASRIVIHQYYGIPYGVVISE